MFISQNSANEFLTSLYQAKSEIILNNITAGKADFLLGLKAISTYYGSRSPVTYLIQFIKSPYT